MRSELPKLKTLLHKALLQTSIHFPGAQHDIVQHLMHHIADGIELHGPPWASAMWPFERLWHVLISQNHSTRWAAISMMFNHRAGRVANQLCDEYEAHLSEAQASHLPPSLAPVPWYMDPLHRPALTLLRSKGRWSARYRTAAQRQAAKRLTIELHLLYLKHSKEGKYGDLWQRWDPECIHIGIFEPYHVA
ncbi:TPA: hypothetical protein ACH3X1_016441 [Trebouxia sp. C0004]